MNTLARILAVMSVFTLAQANSYADEHRGDARHQHRGAWHGDIRHFHERDMDRWRGGRWYHGRHEGHNAWWWIAGGIWYSYPRPVYPYPDPYLPPVVVVPQPPAAVAPPGPPATTQYWYYCPDPAGYYPYIPQCLTDWQKVPASPHQQ